MTVAALADFARRLTSGIDRACGTNTKTAVGDLYRAGRRWLSPVRRLTDPLAIRLGCALGLIGTGEIKLHLGCGRVRFPGFVNADLWLLDGTDVVHDIKRLPWPDGSAAVIQCNHAIEHLPYKAVPGVLKEWFRVLRPGGTLILEMPHFDEAVKDYLSGNERRLVNLFGQQRFPGDTHLYGYNPKRMRELLEAAGFANCREAEPRGAQTADEPCFRIECEKP